jgi:hypothetical protein
MELTSLFPVHNTTLELQMVLQKKTNSEVQSVPAYVKLSPAEENKFFFPYPRIRREQSSFPFWVLSGAIAEE